MRTTLNIDDELLQEAAKLSGIREKTELVHARLKSLIQKLAGERLIALGGCDPQAKAGRRRRSTPCSSKSS